MCGHSNVVYWLQQRGVEPAPELVAGVFQRAKDSPRTLKESEVWEICRHHGVVHAG